MGYIEMDVALGQTEIIMLHWALVEILVLHWAKSRSDSHIGLLPRL